MTDKVRPVSRRGFNIEDGDLSGLSEQTAQAIKALEQFTRGDNYSAAKDNKTDLSTNPLCRMFASLSCCLRSFVAGRRGERFATGELDPVFAGLASLKIKEVMDDLLAFDTGPLRITNPLKTLPAGCLSVEEKNIQRRFERCIEILTRQDIVKFIHDIAGAIESRWYVDFLPALARMTEPAQTLQKTGNIEQANQIMDEVGSVFHSLPFRELAILNSDLTIAMNKIDIVLHSDHPKIAAIGAASRSLSEVMHNLINTTITPIIGYQGNPDDVFRLLDISGVSGAINMARRLHLRKARKIGVDINDIPLSHQIVIPHDLRVSFYRVMYYLLKDAVEQKYLKDSGSIFIVPQVFGTMFSLHVKSTGLMPQKEKLHKNTHNGLEAEKICNKHGWKIEFHERLGRRTSARVTFDISGWAKSRMPGNIISDDETTNTLPGTLRGGMTNLLPFVSGALLMSGVVVRVI